MTERKDEGATERRVKEALREVRDPDAEIDVLSTGFVEEVGVLASTAYVRVNAVGMDDGSAMETVERISEAVSDVDGVEEVRFGGSKAAPQDDGGEETDDGMPPVHRVLRRHEERWETPEGLYDYVVRTPDDDRRYFVRAEDAAEALYDWYG